MMRDSFCRDYFNGEQTYMLIEGCSSYVGCCGMEIITIGSSFSYFSLCSLETEWRVNSFWAFGEGAVMSSV